MTMLFSVFFFISGLMLESSGPRQRVRLNDLLTTTCKRSVVMNYPQLLPEVRFSSPIQSHCPEMIRIHTAHWCL